jgi:peptidoglycan hydrolase-like protein with peptidoglycan-binding domain
MNWKLAGAAAIAVALAGCGTNPEERTGGGAAAGAATGAAVGALGGPVGVGVGALVGAGTGAATGAATTPQQVNLGRPPWDNPNAEVGGRHLASGDDGNSGGGSARVRRLQERLQRAGYDPGPVDGVMGPQTRTALREYRGGTHGGHTQSTSGSSGSGGTNASSTAPSPSTGATPGASGTSGTGTTGPSPTGTGSTGTAPTGTGPTGTTH